MKRSQIVLFAVAIVLSGLIYIPVALNTKSYEKDIKEESNIVYLPISEVQNASHEMTLNSYGQISPITELMVAFEVQGMLVRGNRTLKPGVKFSKGEILFSINQEEVKYTVAARKMGLKSLVAQSIPDFIIDYPAESNKWLNFMDDIQAGLTLPELPAFTNKKERLFWTTRNMLTEYYTIASQEERMAKYTYKAPFSGTVVEVYAEPGSIINPGVQVAKIARTGEFELRVPISIADLAQYKQQTVASFTDSDGNELATGKIARISDVVNQRTQSVDVYYTVSPSADAIIYNGLYMNVSINSKIEKNSVILPRTALKDNSVMVLENNQLRSQEVIIVGSKQDSVYVNGLNNGEKIVLERVGAPSKDIKYLGQER